MTAWSTPVATGAVGGTVQVPGSKSETNRALVLAALADGPGTLSGALEARDTQLMRDALTALGAKIDDSDPLLWRITPIDEVTAGATIDCGLAGTVMRFVPPVAALAPGTVDFTGDTHAKERPMAGLLQALRDLGAGVDGDSLPFTLTGNPDLGATTRILEVDSSATSQYISGLLLVAPRLPQGLTVEHVGDTLPSLPHIGMTVAWLRDAGVVVDDAVPRRWRVQPGPIAAREARVEPDLTNAAVFLAAAAVTGGEVTVPGWPTETDQPGDLIRDILAKMGAEVDFTDAGLRVRGTGVLHGIDVDLHPASELTPVVAALAALASGESRLRNIGHIRGHETDRLAALATEFGRLGIGVEEESDALTITGVGSNPPGDGGTFATYADHRMAHAGAIVGLRLPQVSLDDVSCTSKTMPTFPQLWTDLIATAQS
ncbi:3-phosphoshikimate 1-carboxyvinyltransferase [Parenemella sanctibonifatiensis]|uniref:3-phosphoshikimate 1-carboxyvinyltransferase n=1 Tax=Parenemella sanctibonifatiensis TaxID=2016505 RepID=A0A255EIX0_9ACTN|nr:3-phosphoshikimate 1-carboxyvinyltransferase [Parenemella sanctibonifatiensis]OYN90931.1 3-phosphoshikimate 1-carboxyvinyltransferase [Parenemella sanctibonifatiensis]